MHDSDDDGDDNAKATVLLQKLVFLWLPGWQCALFVRPFYLCLTAKNKQFHCFSAYT